MSTSNDFIFGKRPRLYFNILTVGNVSSGKTTFSEALFKKHEKDGSERDVTYSSSLKLIRCLDISSEYSIRLFESTGFGDAIDNTQSIKNIEGYLKRVHSEYNSVPWNLNTDQCLQELNEKDKRIHCIFYLLQPHQVRSLDIEFFRRIGSLAPVVPIIAKTDCMTHNELESQLIKLRIEIEKLTMNTSKNLIFDFNEPSFQDDVEPSILPEIPEDEPCEPAPLFTEQAEKDGVSVHSYVDLLKPETPSDTAVRFSPTHLDYRDCTVAVSEDLTSDSMDESGEEAPSSVPGVAFPLRGQTFPRVKNIFGVICAITEEGTRKYPWATLSIHNEEFSDFPRLQRLMFESGKMAEMIAQTKRISIYLATKEASKTLYPVKLVKKITSDMKKKRLGRRLLKFGPYLLMILAFCMTLFCTFRRFFNFA